MRIAIMGSGGVGGYFGARLAHGGADVTFIARGAHLQAMREHGLKVLSPRGELHLPNVQAVDNPQGLAPVDLVLISVKLFDTEEAARLIKPLVGPQTAIISFQNGVQKDDILRGIFGSEAIMGGVCYVAVSIAEPGVIRHVGMLERLVFGEYNGQKSARAEAFLQAALAGGIQAELSEDIRRLLWEKYVFLVGLSATTASMQTTIGPIRENPRTRAFLLDIMREVVAVGRAQGVNLPEDYAEQRLAFSDTVAPEMTSSMHHDLQRGNRLEVEWLSGGVVALGEKVGVPAPLNRAVRDILTLRAAGAQRS